MKKNIGIIGFGNMGSAIAERIKTEHKVLAFDKDKSKKAGKDIFLTDSVVDLVKKSDVLILAVKPQDFEPLLQEIRTYAKEKLIISIAAGINTSYIEKTLGVVRVIRVMPNLPAMVGEGMTCLTKGRFATEEDFDFAEDIFVLIGETLRIEEGMMNQATAISGSGPGFLYDWTEGKTKEEITEITEERFIPALTASAEKIGFTSEQARILAQTTGRGSIAFLEKTELSPKEAKNKVASKGGTTEAGLKVLHQSGSLEEAVKAALRRAEELSKKEI